MAAPAIGWLCTNIVVGIIPMRWADVFALRPIAVELFFQGLAIIFNVVENEDIVSLWLRKQAGSCKVAIHQEIELRYEV